MKILFWVSASLVVYAYFGYPLVLWALTKLRARAVLRKEIFPRVSIIIAARNEADKIRQKIHHTLALDYPDEQFEILVASDASDDGTDEIVTEYSGRGVRLVRAPQRKGKEHAQGLAVSVATGEILVFTDAATLLEPDALRSLTQNFADPAVGAVSTEDVIVDALGNPTAEGLYVKYEMWVRRLEGRFHSLVGLSGSCFAIRKELCSDWSPVLASDFMGALRAARRGYRSIADPAALGRFVALVSTQAEMRRKIRTFLRGITVLMANLDLLNPLRHGRFALQLASHKLLRFIAPFLLLTTLTTSGLLSREPLYGVIFWAQAAFYLLACAGGVVSSLQRSRVVRTAYFFTMVQWAMLSAWGKYALGQQQVSWEPSRRQGSSDESEPGVELRARLLGRVRARGRQLLEAFERRRAEALRRNPARLARRLRSADSVLILCQGNVIRSVFAARLLCAALADRKAVSVRSAGLGTVPGWRAHPWVIARCEGLNTDLKDHSSMAVTKEMIQSADVVFVMEVCQAAAVARLSPRAHWKTFLLTCLAPDTPLEIPDPAGKDEATFDARFDEITRALKPVIALLAEHETAAT